MTLAEAAQSAAVSIEHFIGGARVVNAGVTQAIAALKEPAMDVPMFRAGASPIFKAGPPLFRARRLSESINFLPGLLSESINFVPGDILFRAGPPLFRVPDWAFFTWPEWAFIFSDAPQPGSIPFQIKGGLPR